MARQIFRNNVTSLLAGSLASGATSLGVSAGSGVLFPSPTAGDFFLATLYETDVSGNETRFEVVQVTARSGDVLTIVRDFESMTGSAGGYAYPSTAGKTVYFDCRWTAYAANNSLQASSNLGDLASASIARGNLGLGNVDNTSDATILAAAAVDATNKANARQATLVSGDNLKTVNGESLLGSGNIEVGDVRQAGSDLALTRQMLKDCGCAFFDSSTTNEINYTNGSVQRWAPATGAQTLSIINWPPSGNLGELFIEGIKLAAATITFPAAAVFIKSDGKESTFAASGITLQASGTDWLYIWTRDAGTKIYIKVVR